MNETQKKRYQHLSNPGVVISMLVAIFGIWVTRGTLNYRINRLEDFQKEIDLVEIQSTLTAMQKDIEWIRIQLQK